jgi:hypothetical protein
MRSDCFRGTKSSRVLVRRSALTHYVTRAEFKAHLRKEHSMSTDDDGDIEVTTPTGYSLHARGRYSLAIAVLAVIALGLWLWLR